MHGSSNFDFFLTLRNSTTRIRPGFDVGVFGDFFECIDIKDWFLCFGRVAKFA